MCLCEHEVRVLSEDVVAEICTRYLILNWQMGSHVAQYLVYRSQTGLPIGLRTGGSLEGDGLIVEHHMKRRCSHNQDVRIGIR